MCSFLNSYLKINLIDVVQSEQFNQTLIFLNGSVYTAQFLCLILIGLLKVDSKIHLPIPEFFGYHCVQFINIIIDEMFAKYLGCHVVPAFDLGHRTVWYRQVILQIYYLTSVSAYNSLDLLHSLFLFIF